MENKINVTTTTEEEKKMGPFIVTYTNKRIYFNNFTVDDVSIIDIAHALSNLCRFTGHTKEFYSVAQHSVLVSRAQKSIKEKRAGLLHDATEIYLNDLASPLKHSIDLGEYQRLEDYFHSVINEKYNINDGMTQNIKKADLQALFTEKRDVLNHNDDWGWGDDIERFEEVIIPLPPKEAKELFLNEFKKLFPEINIDIEN